MKKSIYVLIIMFLIHGKGFANVTDFSNTWLINSIEETVANEKCALCTIPLKECLEHSFPSNQENKDTNYCTNTKQMESPYIAMLSFISNNVCETKNNSKPKLFEVSYTTNLNSENLKIKRLQNVNVDEYFAQSKLPFHYRGFGVRFTIF